MLKGLFSGGIWGLLVGGAVLTTASLIAEQPAGNAPPLAPQVTAPQTTQAPEQAPEQAPAQIPAATSDPSPNVALVEKPAPRVVAPQFEITQPVADVTSATVPQTGAAAGGLTAPDPMLPAPDVVAARDAPVLPKPQALAPQIPAGEQDLTVATQPAPTPAPKPTPVGIANGAVPTVDIAVPVPVVPKEVVMAVPAIIPADPVSTLPAGDGSVKVNRSVGAPAGLAAKEPVEADDDAALVRFGAPFDNLDAKPLLSIVLIDDGSMAGAVPALRALPFPVTVILDPSAADAPAKMAQYRSAGLEVGMLAALPSGATAANVEVAFEATFNAFPQTVLMLDAGTGGLPNDRAVTDQAMAYLAAGGRGFVTVSKGLSTSLRAARGADVPAAAIYRDLDSEGQDARVIRRFLDEAAFRARQESGVILLARVRPDTISALVLWGTANRAGQVVLAPASAVLLAQ